MLQDYYSKEKDYSKISRGRKEGILELLGDSNGKTILDIGCGQGVLGGILKDQYDSVEVHGLDISEEAIDKANDTLNEVSVFDLEKINQWPVFVKKSSYDAIVISEVLEHLFFPEKLLHQIKEITRSDTNVIITVPNILFWKNRLRILLGSFEYEKSGLMDRGHIHFFSWNSLREMVEEAGYEIIDTAHHTPTRGTKMFADTYPNFVAYQFIIKIQRKHDR